MIVQCPSSTGKLPIPVLPLLPANELVHPLHRRLYEIVPGLDPVTDPHLLNLTLLYTSIVADPYYSDDNYPNNSYRDRIRFLLFCSWWTVVFAAGYLAFFLINAGSFLVSIASHGIWLALT